MTATAGLSTVARKLLCGGHVTPPRRVLPGALWLVTSRAVHRLFRFAPGPTTNHLVRYLVAYAFERYGVGLVGMTWMSNHAHLVVVDPQGRLPDAVRLLDALLARALNALRGDRGAVFERGNVDLKELVGREAVIVALAYVAANPVAAGCVEHGREWPGVRSRAKDLGRSEEITRPEGLFRHRALGYRGRLPERVTLHHVVPEVCGERGRMVHDVEVAVGEAEARARDEVLASGRGFLGRARCVGRSPDERGTAYEAAGPGTGPEPVLATDAAERAERVMAWRWFWDAYRAALGLWRTGIRTVEFPPGTWALVRLHGARAGPSAA